MHAKAEMRGIWISDPRPYDWVEVLDNIKSAGFNNIFVNFASAGVAFYPSKHLPQRKTKQSFDFLIAEAKKRNIRVHAKILTFFMYWAPQEQIEKMISDHRVLKNIKGKVHLQNSMPWLDPSQKENREQAKKIIFEILDKYDVDGMQLDYIRFYEELEVPDSIMHIRRSILTNFTFDLALEMRRKAPGKRFSACVFYDLHRAKNEMAQDWQTWIDKKIFNFLVPMNYTTSKKALRSWLHRQEKIRDGRTTFYSGLGSYMPKMTPKKLKSQIKMIRKSKLPGYILFAYNDDFVKRMLPSLKKKS